ncbi:MAG TPA: hypothetical protein VNN07_14475 [Candidatus Tectomicrobia bacterium]|nr:hypothetical protein [Candidatus Tectomicrobia bacterium]
MGPTRVPCAAACDITEPAVIAHPGEVGTPASRSARATHPLLLRKSAWYRPSAR